MSMNGGRGLALRGSVLFLIGWAGFAFAVEESASASGGTVPVMVRVQGLALGSQLQLSRDGEMLAVNLNGQFVLPGEAIADSPLSIVVTSQPMGQACAISELAPSTVPADSSPIFVRCRSLPSAPVVVSETQPDGPIRVLHGESSVRTVAYPGLPYESRLGVVGGTFPYEFRILAATIGGVPTSDISIDFRHGTLRFTPEVETSISIDIEIRDSAAVQRVLTHNVVIQAATAPFVFVAPDGIDNAGRGSLALPYRTLGYALPRTSAGQAVVLRRGTYLTGGFSLADSSAKTILGFPDEVAEIDLNYAGSITVRISQLPGVRLENLDIRRVQQYGIFSDPGSPGLVLRHLRFVEGREGSTPNENPAFLHGRGDSPMAPRHAMIVQDSDFGPFQMLSSGAYALTLYDVGDSLFENNQIRTGATTGGIHDKDNSQRNTYRENYISFAPENANRNGIQVSAQANSSDVHVHHNLLVNSGIRLGLQCFQESCYMRNHGVHHNTLAGAGFTFGWGIFNPTSFGTRLSHNILSTGNAAPYAWHSCLGAVPAAFDTQLEIGANLIETTHSLAMHDTECSGGPMNIGWSTWQSTHGMDSTSSGSEVTATSALVGAGPTLGLPESDPRRPERGHLYVHGPATVDSIFADGFE